MTPTPTLRRRTLLACAAVGVPVAILAPGRTTRSSTDPRPRVVTTTGILADLARGVCGADAVVESLVPEGGDPHTYEPTPRDVRAIARADVAFSNYLMLEERALIATLDANLHPGARHLALAEAASTRGAEIIQLVENRALDAVWLGLRVVGGPDTGSAAPASAPASTTARLAMVRMDGPGDLHGYITGTFGQPERVFDSSDGGSARHDAIDLPIGAHTHMSWAFTAAGVYRMGLVATTSGLAGTRIAGELVIVAGGDPATLAPGRTVIDRGHADITADLDAGALVLRVDSPDGPTDHRLADVVIHVAPKNLLPVPSDPAFGFIARPGTDVYQLPQAVLGKHVHGEIDPHLWQDVRNAQVYVQVIRDEMIGVDPAHGPDYRRRADQVVRDLDAVDAYVRRSIASIPAARRQLVTTHDAYGYLAHRYGMTVAGVVSPAPGREPSIADRRRLMATLTELGVRSVFIEPTAGPTARSLRDAAHDAGVAVGPIWGDSFTAEVHTYADMMRANADSLARGLGGTPLGDHDLAARNRQERR